MTAYKASVIIADDHDLIRLALRKIFEVYDDYQVDFEAKDYYELIEILKHNKPDILLLDLNMPGKSGIELLREIRETYPALKIVVLTVDDSSSLVSKAMAIGAQGYLLKENAISEIHSALDEISKGKNYISRDMMTKMLASKKEDEGNILNVLSARELEVLFLISKGKTNKEIGEILFLSEKTVRNYSSTVFRKLDVNDRLSASILALKNGIEEILGTNVPNKSGRL